MFGGVERHRLGCAFGSAMLETIGLLRSLRGASTFREVENATWIRERSILRRCRCFGCAGVGFGAPSTWTYNGGNAAWTADWLVASNWSFVGVPNSTLSTATFPSSSIAGGSGTVLLNAAVLDRRRRFSFVGTGTASSNNYTLGGTGSLTLPDSGTISVSAAGGLDWESQPSHCRCELRAGATIFKTGEGTLVLGGSNGFVASQCVRSQQRDCAHTSSRPLPFDNDNHNGGWAGRTSECQHGRSVTMAGLGSSVPKSTGVISSSVGNNTWAGNWFIVSTGQSVGVSAGSTLTLNGSIIDGPIPR